MKQVKNVVVNATSTRMSKYATILNLPVSYLTKGKVSDAVILEPSEVVRLRPALSALGKRYGMKFSCKKHSDSGEYIVWRTK